MSDAPPPYPQQPQQPQQSAPPPYGQQPPSAAPPPYGQQPPPQQYPQHSAPAADIRPKARWFWIGGGIIVLGIVGAIAFGIMSFLGIADKVDGFARVSPGTDTIRIESTGEYVIYAEDGSFFASVEVISPDGEPVPTSRYLTDLNYSFEGRTGQAVATFEARDTGRFTITTDTRVAIGGSIAGDLLRTILLPFVIVGLTFLIGLVVIIVTAVKRSGSKKRAAA